MDKTVIITSYLETLFDIKKKLNPDDYVICTDGGYDIALEYNITPDLILGDFDSLKADLPASIANKRFPPEKDYTDLELAIKTAVELGSEKLEIIGGMGGRLDHTVANLQLLASYSKCFSSLIMYDGRNKCFVLYGDIEKKYAIPQENNSYISLFSLSEKCTGVTIQGVKYPLCDHTLVNDLPLGVSNEFTKKNAALSIKNGILLVIISKK